MEPAWDRFFESLLSPQPKILSMIALFAEIYYTRVLLIITRSSKIVSRRVERELSTTSGTTVIQVCVAFWFFTRNDTYNWQFYHKPSLQAQVATRSDQGEDVDVDIRENVRMPINDVESLGKISTCLYNS